jgi:hypothetical protein
MKKEIDLDKMANKNKNIMNKNRSLYGRKTIAILLIIIIIMLSSSFALLFLFAPHQYPIDPQVITTTKGYDGYNYTFTLISIQNPPVLKKDVFVIMKNQTGSVNLTATPLTLSLDNGMFTYFPKSSGDYLSIGDIFKIQHATATDGFGQGSVIALSYPPDADMMYAQLII